MPTTSAKTTRPIVLGLALALALGACNTDRIISGSPPMGKTRPFEDGKRDTTSPSGTPGMAGGVSKEDLRRTGVLSTQEYHALDCERLEGAPGADRVPFVQNYDALDAGYYPCSECKPGP